jgi:hypothetical protein
MAQKWELPSGWVSNFREIRNELENYVLDLRDQFDEQSEKWQESEKGQAVETWLEELDEIAETMDRLEDAPEES